MHSRHLKHSVQSDNTAIGFQIAPMIDVVFVIMLFFMVMTGTMKIEKDLSLKLPDPGNPLKPVEFPAEEITIGVLEDGTVTLNDAALDSATDKNLPKLTKALKQTAESSARQKQKLLVTIQAEEQASYERIIDVLNALQKAEIQNVTFTVGSETF